MSQDNKERTEKKNNHITKISIVSVLAAALFVIEIYEIINDPGNLVAIGALGVFLLGSVLTGVLMIGRLMEKKAQEQQEAFENVFRSEKAAYLLLRKYFDQMEQKMDSIGDNNTLPFKELISAQKALAKAQINRNKQNTNALLISNDRMMQRISKIQNEITKLNAEAGVNSDDQQIFLNEQDKEVLLGANRDVLNQQQEILNGLKEMEASLKNEILESVNKMTVLKSEKRLESELPNVQQDFLSELKFADDAVPELQLTEDTGSELQLTEDAVPELQSVEDIVPELQTVEDTVSDLQSLDDSLSDLQSGDDSISELQSLDDSMLELQSSDDSISELQSVDDSIPELQFVDDSIPELQSADDSIPELQSADDSIPELQSADDSIPELQSADDSIPELQSADDSILGLQSVDDSIPDLQSVDDSISELQSIGESIPDLQSVDDIVPDLQSLEDITPALQPIDVITPDLQMPGQEDLAELKMSESDSQDTLQLKEVSTPELQNADAGSMPELQLEEETMPEMQLAEDQTPESQLGEEALPEFQLQEDNIAPESDFPADLQPIRQESSKEFPKIDEDDLELHIPEGTFDDQLSDDHLASAAASDKTEEVLPNTESMLPNMQLITEENVESDLSPLPEEDIFSDLQPILENVLADLPPVSEEMIPKSTVMENETAEEPILPDTSENPEENVLPDLASITDENSLADLPPIEEEDVLPHLASILEENMLPHLPSMEEEKQPEVQKDQLSDLAEKEKEQKLKQPGENSSESALDKLLMQMKNQQTAVTESVLSPLQNKPELEPAANKTELPSSNGQPEDTKTQSAALDAGANTNLPKNDRSGSETAENEQDLKEHAASENPSEEGQEITPDKLAAMIANLGTANIEMDTEKEKPQEPVMAETLEPVRDAAEPSQEQELDDILKAMDIDDILGESVEDLDIDKILEVPVSADGKKSSGDGQVMSSEEIAALIANTDLLSETDSVPAKNTDMSDLPDLSDPSHVMSSDEIAALLANM